MTHRILTDEEYDDLMHQTMIAFFNRNKTNMEEKDTKYLKQIHDMDIDEELKNRIISVVNKFRLNKKGDVIFMKIKDVVKKYQLEAEQGNKKPNGFISRFFMFSKGSDGKK